MYPSDISDKEWEILKQHFEPKKTGRPRKHSTRVISKVCNENRLPMEANT
nr:hypothetical protein [Wolbachia endosymbiont of Pentalonia nigronervosa]